jgi:hypothetical protein
MDEEEEGRGRDLPRRREKGDEKEICEEDEFRPPFVQFF